MTAAEWQIVLTADGAVLAVTGGAPAAWVGARLEDRADFPLDVRQAVRALLDDLHGSTAPIATRFVRGASSEAIQLIAIEAVPLRRAAVDLRALLESIANVMRPQASAMDVELKLDLDRGQPASIFVDGEKVAWALTALVGNALRYVRRGSRLMPGGLISIRTTYEAAASEVTVAVHDDGLGIPEDKLPSLFRRAPDRPVAGALGLKMVFDVVAAHGGRVDVESRTDPVNHGTTVRLMFPVL